MLQKVKKIFSKFREPKRLAVFFAGTVAMGLLLPGICSASILPSASDIASALLNAFILGFAAQYLGLWVFAFTLASMLLGWVTGPGFITYSYTGMDNPVVAAGWPVVRDLSNMFIVLAFVVVGIATSLRIKDYEATKLLPKLIVVAVLINFSPMICGLAIDFSNVLTNHFLTMGGQTSLGFLNAVKKIVYQLVSPTSLTMNPLDYIAMVAGVGFFCMMGTIIFLLYACLFFFRYVALWILVILSPLAFVSYVFDFTKKKIFDVWFDQFFEWCIIGIPGAFFLYLADILTFNSKPMANGSVTGVIATLTMYMVPSTFLVAGFMVSLETGARGAGAITGAIKSGGKAAWAGAKKGAVSAWNRSAPGQKVNSAVTRAGENMGLVAGGTDAMRKQALLKDANARMEAQRTDNPTAFKRTLEQGGGTVDSAAALQVAAGHNELHKYDRGRVAAGVRAATGPGGHGIPLDTFTKVDPTLAMQNPNNPTPKDLRAINGVVGGMDKKETRKLVKTGVPVRPQVLASLGGGQMDDLLKNGTPNQVKTLLQSATGTELKGQLAYARTLKASGNTEDVSRLIANIRKIRATRIKAPTQPPQQTPPAPPAPKEPNPSGFEKTPGSILYTPISVKKNPPPPPTPPATPPPSRIIMP